MDISQFSSKCPILPALTYAPIFPQQVLPESIHAVLKFERKSCKDDHRESTVKRHASQARLTILKGIMRRIL